MMRRKAMVVVAHEIMRIIYFMLRRSELYRGESRGIDGEKIKEFECEILKWPTDLRNAAQTSELQKTM